VKFTKFFSISVQVRLFAARSTYVGTGRIGSLNHIADIGTIGLKSTFSMEYFIKFVSFGDLFIFYKLDFFVSLDISTKFTHYVFGIVSNRLINFGKNRTTYRIAVGGTIDSKSTFNKLL